MHKGAYGFASEDDAITDAKKRIAEEEKGNSTSLPSTSKHIATR